MKVLFIGGSGVISSACSALALERGIDLFLLNRGVSVRPVPAGAQTLGADIYDPDAVRSAIADHKFDAVVDWIAFKPEHIERDIKLFRGRTDQFIFISSASAYQKPLTYLPITESTPLGNRFWQYSRDKIACEESLMRAFREDDFPITIVRPSHTYDRTMLPLKGRYTVIDRMRKGKKVIVHGDGTSLWVLTHNTDFAKGFVGLLGNSAAIGEAFHITSDRVLTWNEIFTLSARAAGTIADILHVPSDVIAKYDVEWGAELFGDKANSVIFDNSKIKRLIPDFASTVPFSKGIQEIIEWYDADPARQAVDESLDRLMDKIIHDYASAFDPQQKAAT
ncbi:MAG: SDR family oxidoreductase [Acidobacteriota bacterium]